jgi:hypothetical protein
MKTTTSKYRLAVYGRHTTMSGLSCYGAERIYGDRQHETDDLVWFGGTDAQMMAAAHANEMSADLWHVRAALAIRQYLGVSAEDCAKAFARSERSKKAYASRPAVIAARAAIVKQIEARQAAEREALQLAYQEKISSMKTNLAHAERRQAAEPTENRATAIAHLKAALAKMQ